ncbi:hypothetical protein V8D89_005019 [Ganoderma adspersum]
MESYGLSLASHAGVLATYDSLAINSYGRVASAAFIFYDYAMTFDQEVEMFWKDAFAQRRLTGATILFLINRYLVLVLRLANLVGFVPMTDKRCALATKVALGFTLLQYVPWAGERRMSLTSTSPNLRWPTILRIEHKQADIPAHLCAVNGYDFCQSGEYNSYCVGYVDPLFGCTVIDPVSLDLSRKYVMYVSRISLNKIRPANSQPRNPPVVIICRTCFILADVLLILITWFTISWNSLVDSMGTKDVLTLAEVVLRNGTTYFVALLFMHCLHLTLSLCSIHVALQGLSYGYVTVFTEVVEAALVSRFLLDLQMAHRQALDMNPRSEQGSARDQTDTLVFGLAVGSWGSMTGSVMDGDQTVDQQWEVGEEDGGRPARGNPATPC